MWHYRGTVSHSHISQQSSVSTYFDSQPVLFVSQYNSIHNIFLDIHSYFSPIDSIFTNFLIIIQWLFFLVSCTFVSTDVRDFKQLGSNRHFETSSPVHQLLIKKNTFVYNKEKYGEIAPLSEAGRA